MKKTRVEFSSIKDDKDMGLMFGCYCGDNLDMIDAVVSLLNVSIQGKFVRTIDIDEDNIVYVGFGDRSNLSKSILYNKDFVIYHFLREFIRMEEDIGQ